MAECRDTIKKYYSCFTLLYQMAVLFINHSSAAHKEQQNELITEARSLSERIVSESGDALLARDALYIQCVCLIALKSPYEVFDLLGESFRMPDITEDSLITQAFQLTGNMGKAKEVAQCSMYHYLFCHIEAMLHYISLIEDDFIQAQTALERAMTLIRLYGVEKLNADALAKAYLIGASMYCKHGDFEQTLELLGKYADLCLNKFLPFKLRGDEFFTDIDEWLDSGELGSSIIYNEKMLKNNMLNSLTQFPAFNTLENNPRYKSIVQKITDFLNTD
jgi:hypothetical protein